MTATAGYPPRGSEFPSRWDELCLPVFTQAARDVLLGDLESAAFVSEVEDGLTRRPKGSEVDISSATIHAIRRRS